MTMESMTIRTIILFSQKHPSSNPSHHIFKSFKKDQKFKINILKKDHFIKMDHKRFLQHSFQYPKESKTF